MRAEPNALAALSAVVWHDVETVRRLAADLERLAPALSSEHCESRDLAARGMVSETYYALPLHAWQCFADRWPPAAERSRVCPVAERLASEFLSLPVFPELDRVQQERVIEVLGEFVQQ